MQGPSGARLEFQHDRRGSTASLDEVGRLLLNICTCTPQVSTCHMHFDVSIHEQRKAQRSELWVDSHEQSYC